jgi:NAD(P)-dependent dehydrogenase (short-subunit alcohol dehydrogenase family)
VNAVLLAGESAIVTGAGSGIGRAIAKALAHEGADLLVTDIAAEAGQSVANEIRHIGRQAHFVLADLSDQEAPQRIFEAAIGRFGKVSLLIHCASPPHWGRTLVSAPEEDWSRMIAVNVMAACRLGRLVGEHMRTNEIRGRMLFITSLHARTPSLGPAAHYAVAKSGLRTLSRQLAYYYGPFGIRVNSIAPGMIAEDFSPLYEPYARTAALRRVGRPDEIANVAVALLSDRFGSFVTGVDLEVDGGLALYNCMPDPN